MSHNNHQYHLVDLSPWPILTSTSLLFVTSGGIMYMHKVSGGSVALVLGVLFLLYCMIGWWKDVIQEGLVGKYHTSVVRNGLKIGVILFILSEVMFFFGFFWSFFKFRFNPVDLLEDIWPLSEGTWPPKGITLFDPWNIPFMNTLILLLSGCTLTWSHHALKENNREDFTKMLGYTIILGVIFTSLQAFEYIHAPFKFTDGIYPSNFFMATGFHGAHVIIGTIFLMVCYIRALKGHFYLEKEGHLGFEFAAWYWHFVDVVWLFLFIFMYIFGG